MRRPVVGLLAAWLGATAYADQWDIPLFLSGLEPGRHSFARVHNSTNVTGSITVEALDETGQSYGEFTLDFAPRERRHFNSFDVAEHLGSPGVGHWRLVIEADMPIWPTAYVRSEDGFLAPMNKKLPEQLRDDGSYRYVARTFNPASNIDRVSQLLLVNPGARTAELVVRAWDDVWDRVNEGLQTTLPAGRTLTLTASELEQAWNTDGRGKWYVVVISNRPIIVLNLLESLSTGHLINLSSDGAYKRQAETGSM